MTLVDCMASGRPPIRPERGETVHPPHAATAAGSATSARAGGTPSRRVSALRERAGDGPSFQALAGTLSLGCPWPRGAGRLEARGPREAAYSDIPETTSASGACHPSLAVAPTKPRRLAGMAMCRLRTAGSAEGASPLSDDLGDPATARRTHPEVAAPMLSAISSSGGESRSRVRGAAHPSPWLTARQPASALLLDGSPTGLSTRRTRSTEPGRPSHGGIDD